MVASREKFEVLLRLRAIELIPYWEGRLVTSHLLKHFGISRQQASSDIKKYITAYNPDSLEYSNDLKCYQPSVSFKLKLTTVHMNEYMGLMSGLESLSSPITFIQEPNIAAVHLPDRAVRPRIVRGVLEACRSKKKTIIITYTSMVNSISHQRIISPHKLIYTGFCWHMRGYCHQRKDFRDFVLSRIKTITSVVKETFVGNTTGDEWHNEVELVIRSRPELSQGQAKLIAADYGMDDVTLKIYVKQALVNYTLYRYQVAIKAEEQNKSFDYPLALSAKTSSAIQQYLFGGSYKC